MSSDQEVREVRHNSTVARPHRHKPERWHKIMASAYLAIGTRYDRHTWVLSRYIWMRLRQLGFEIEDALKENYQEALMRMEADVLAHERAGLVRLGKNGNPRFALMQIEKFKFSHCHPFVLWELSQLVSKGEMPVYDVYICQDKP